ncbi:MAG: amidohydrolase family protein [Planctomycetota bacterium]|jgi:predicted TIM-barrel fold metal-dependent hydrolase
MTTATTGHERSPVTASAPRTVWIDCEVHVFPPQWCGRGFAPPPDEPVLRRVVYDHPERDAALSRATVEDLLEEMDRAGVDRALIMGLPWRSAERCRAHDDYVARCVREHPGRLSGLGLLPRPGTADPRDVVRRCADLGLRGVKAIPSWQGWRLDDPALAPACEELAARGMILMTHVDHAFVAPERADLPYHVLEVARRHPDLRILAAHLGGLLCLYELHEPVRRIMRNVRFITSVPLTVPMVRFAVEAVGARRLAFGTDFPFNPSHDQASVRRAVEALRLAPDDQRLVAGAAIAPWLEAAQ